MLVYVPSLGSLASRSANRIKLTLAIYRWRCDEKMSSSGGPLVNNFEVPSW